MKTRTIAITLCVALAACDKVKDVPNPLAGDKQGPQTASPTSTIDAYKAAIATQDWQKLYGLLSSEFQKQAQAEVEGLKKDLAGGDAGKKQAAEARIRERGMKPEQFAKQDAASLAAEWVGMEAMKGSPRLPKVIKETKAIKVDERKASVDYLGPDDANGTLRFTKENGAWRFAP